MTSTPRLVPVLYLDLDGTVRHGKTELGRFVNGPDDVVVFPEAVDRMRAWKAAGGRIVGVTNQGGVALGHVTEEAVLEALGATLWACEGLFDMVLACQHHPAAADPLRANCWCRKPRPGMPIAAALDLHRAHPDEVYPPHLARFVGDRPEDQQCAEALGIEFQWAAEWRAGHG